MASFQQITPTIKSGHMAAPALIHATDYRVFKRTKKEKGELATMKKNNKDDRKAEFGSDYKKHLNTTNNKIIPSLKFTF